MVDRVSDADRLAAIELVNNLDSKLLDYATENKDKLYLQASLYDKLEAAGLEPRNPRHWELISESLEGKLKQTSLVLKSEVGINTEQANFKSLYLHKCGMVQRELIEIFKGYLESGKRFEIDSYRLESLTKDFFSIKFDRKVLIITLYNEKHLISSFKIRKTLFRGIKFETNNESKINKYGIKILYYGDFFEGIENIYGQYFNSDSTERIEKFYDFYSDLCKLPAKMRLIKEKWDSYVLEENRKYSAQETEKKFKAEQTRKEILLRMTK